MEKSVNQLSQVVGAAITTHVRISGAVCKYVGN